MGQNFQDTELSDGNAVDLILNLHFVSNKRITQHKVTLDLLDDTDLGGITANYLRAASAAFAVNE